MRVFFLSVGALNVLMNVIVWTIHSMCCLAAVSVYARAASFELRRTGKTYSTDSSDVTPEDWLLGKKFRRWRVLSWWTVVILFINVALLPVELWLESGIDESNKCRPKTIPNSTGVCASPMVSVASDSEIYSQMMLIANVVWHDSNWDAVPVGASKWPKPSEVRVKDRIQSKNRRFVITNCKVKVNKCIGSQCGSVTVVPSNGVFRTIVRNWTVKSASPGSDWERGDLTWNSGLLAVFAFKEYGSSPVRNVFNRTEIRVIGVEMLPERNVWKYLSNPHKGFSLPMVGSQARKYMISCQTDGLRAKDLARAVSLYRTANIEQPDSNGNEMPIASTLKPFEASDVVKASYALKSERWSDTCIGDVEVYRTCGTLNLWSVLPFGVVATGIFVAWIAVRCSIGEVTETVPHDAESWRQIALQKEVGHPHAELDNCNGTPPVHSRSMEPFSSGTPAIVDTQPTNRVNTPFAVIHGNRHMVMIVGHNGNLMPRHRDGLDPLLRIFTPSHAED